MGQVSEPAYIQNVIQQVENCMTPECATSLDEDSSSVTPIKFQQILGESDDYYWWRLYINPMDWDKALKAVEEYHANPAGKKPDQSHPGSLYNYDKIEVIKPKAVREAITGAYSKYLLKGALNANFGAGKPPLKWTQYKQMWTDARPPNPPGSGHFADREGGHLVQYGGPRAIASDTYEKIMYNTKDGIDLVDDFKTQTDYENFKKMYKNTPAQSVVSHVNNADYLYAELTGKQLTTTVEAVFANFNADMAAASSRRQQLQAIARVIRNLHMIHAFTDGCGRTNVFLLLPILLLEFGFGLPLGGQYGQSIPKDAIFMMFNGGYSIEQIANFLWVTQDFGLIKHTKDCTAIGDLPAKAIAAATSSAAGPSSAPASQLTQGPVRAVL